MSDIVERLRQEKWRLAAMHCEEAADTIERLRDSIDEQRRTIECLMAGMPEDGTTPVIRRIAALEGEIELLRAELELERRVNATHDEGFDAVVEQNAALRAELAAAQQAQERGRKWTLLLVGEQHGLVGFYGSTFDGSPEYYERVNVYTAPPARQPLTEPLDVCTDPDNCKRCKAPQWEKHKYVHAGLQAHGIGRQE
jgi:hypothetical protein